MALKSTIFKAELQLADLDRSHFGDYSLTIARHPSETDERMMVRLFGCSPLRQWAILTIFMSSIIQQSLSATYPRG